MLNSGKNFALCATIIVNIPTLKVVRKNFMNEKKTKPPSPCKLNDRSLIKKNVGEGIPNGRNRISKIG